MLGIEWETLGEKNQGSHSVCPMHAPSTEVLVAWRKGCVQEAAIGSVEADGRGGETVRGRRVKETR